MRFSYIILFAIFSGCTSYTANQIGPLPKNYEEIVEAVFVTRNHQYKVVNISQPRLTNTGWFVCATYEKTLNNGAAITNIYTLRIFEGKINGVKIDPFCYIS